MKITTSFKQELLERDYTEGTFVNIPNGESKGLRRFKEKSSQKTEYTGVSAQLSPNWLDTLDKAKHFLESQINSTNAKNFSDR